jgi:hypothetical protein
MNTTRPMTLAAAALALALTAAPSFGTDPGTPRARTHAGAWRALFEASGAKAWRGWLAPGLPAGWRVTDGVLAKDAPVDDLVTIAPYTNFELELEWKLAKGGNSGIFYRGTREYDHIYWSAPEYQLLDDANAKDGAKRETAAASAYALYAPPAGVVHAFNEWNSTRIIVSGNHVEHWLNGKKVVEYELSSPDWLAKVKASKFAAYPNYGLAKSGLIGIQGDHDGALAIRKARIRELK